MQDEPLHNERVEIDKFSGLTRASLLRYLDCPARQNQVVRRSVEYLREAARLAYASNVSHDFSKKYQMIVTPIVRPRQTQGTTEYVVQTVDNIIDDLLSRPPFTIGGYNIDFNNLPSVTWKDLIKHLNSDEAKKYFQCKKNLCQEGGGTYENLCALAEALHYYLSYLSNVIPPSGSGIGITLQRLCFSPIVSEGVGNVALAIVISKLTNVAIPQRQQDIVPGLIAILAETIEFVTSRLLIDRVIKNRIRDKTQKGIEFSFGVIARRRGKLKVPGKIKGSDTLKGEGGAGLSFCV